MRTTTVKKLLHQASQRLNDQIALATDQTSLYSRGLSQEGYAAGYRDGLQAAALLLNGVMPSNDRLPGHVWDALPPGA